MSLQILQMGIPISVMTIVFHNILVIALPPGKSICHSQQKSDL
jgi:hypothetical protein